jgi:uncharacterized surface protein with fasciclin (FAS1) repeats
MMKRKMITTLLFGLLSSTSALVPVSAFANNRGVETALANYGDVSVFYQALINTGVLAELDPNTNYTIFAPTNEAFAQIQPNMYPCFYSTQCRAQVADVLRNHIVVGSESLADLTKDVHVPTIGRYRVYAESPYVGDYTIAHHGVLSGAEINGNMVYRLDGVIISDEQLAQFRAMPPVANVQERMIVTSYHPDDALPVPGSNANLTVSRQTYITPASSATKVYPDGTQVTTTSRTYVTPDGYPAGGEETTVTSTVTSEP